MDLKVTLARLTEVEKITEYQKQKENLENLPQPLCRPGAFYNV